MTATYLYCIVKSTVKPSSARCPEGLPGAERPQALPIGGSLWLILAQVPLATYGPEPLEARLADMDWVGSVALAHERVVEHFARRAVTVVIPMKLFTMFTSVDRAVTDIAARKRTLDAAMNRIAGAEEWGVRVMRGPAVAPEETTSRAASGTAFLAAKKQAKDAAKSAKLAAAAAADDAFEELAALARDARQRREAPPAGAVAPLLDAAFLVAAAGRHRFKSAASRAAARCASAGARMTISGPWPAYNFVHEEEQR